MLKVTVIVSTFMVIFSSLIVVEWMKEREYTKKCFLKLKDYKPIIIGYERETFQSNFHSVLKN